MLIRLQGLEYDPKFPRSGPPNLGKVDQNHGAMITRVKFQVQGLADLDDRPAGDAAPINREISNHADSVLIPGKCDQQGDGEPRCATDDHDAAIASGVVHGNDVCLISRWTVALGQGRG